MLHNKNQEYFINTSFISSVVNLKHLLSHASKEVAFVGRSNTGKSSIINVVTQKNNLAIVSKIPGRTRAINYFQVTPNKYLVDLPGYGYAKVNDQTRLAWRKLLEGYFSHSSGLCGIILIIDIRRAWSILDQQMVEFCQHHALPIHVILNKADQLNRQQGVQAKSLVQSALLKYYSATVQIFSARTKNGIEELQEKIIDWLEK